MSSNPQYLSAVAERVAPVYSRVAPALRGLQWFSRRCTSWTVLFAGFIVVPAIYLTGNMDIETVNMLGRYLAIAMVALGLDLVWGYTGMLSLCQAFFFALGGYAMGMHLVHHGPVDLTDAAGWQIPRALYVVYPYAVGEAPGDAILPWFWKPFYYLPATLILGLLIPGLVALSIGYFVFRSGVRGVFFAILTQAITLAAWLMFSMNNMKLCGTNGLTNFEKLAGFDLREPNVKLGLYLLTLVSLTGVYLLCRAVESSRLGRVLIAIRDNESRLRFSGYQPYHYKVFAFTLAAMIAGLGGMLYAPQMGIFAPSDMTVVKSILVVIWVAVGGRGTLSGAILGALVVNLVYNSLTTRSPEAWPLVQGGLFIGVVLFFPNGLMSLWHRWTAERIDTSSGIGSEESGPSTHSTDDSSGGDDIERRLSRLAILQRSGHSSRSILDSELMRVSNIKVVFDGFQALDIESFTVQHYELQVIIGPNGAGKTTLCDVISGKTRVTSGKVFFAATDVTTLSEVEIARLGVGRKFQTPTLFDSLTVYENMALSLPGQQSLARNFRSRETEEQRQRIESILERVRLIDRVQSRVKHLSHGQRQWLEISMLILARPMLLLVDEPAAGLTDEETALTAELLLELQTEHSIIVIEHDMEFVRLLNSRVTVLNEGRIMAQGTIDEVQANPEVLEAYLGR